MNKLRNLIMGVAATFVGGALAIPASADVTVGGFMNQRIGFGDYRGGKESDDSIHFRTDAEVLFTGTGTTDGGLKITARVELEGDSGGDQIDENWLSVEGNFGKVTLGGEDPAVITHGYVGIGSGFGNIGTYDSGDTWTPVGSEMYPVGYGDYQGIRYSTPQLGGFSAGFSYQPEAKDAGGSQTSVDNDHAIVSVAGSFSTQLGAVSLTIGGGFLGRDDNPKDNPPDRSFAQALEERRVEDPEAQSTALYLATRDADGKFEDKLSAARTAVESAAAKAERDAESRLRARPEYNPDEAGGDRKDPDPLLIQTVREQARSEVVDPAVEEVRNGDDYQKLLNANYELNLKALVDGLAARHTYYNEVLKEFVTDNLNIAGGHTKRLGDQWGLGLELGFGASTLYVRGDIREDEHGTGYDQTDWGVQLEHVMGNSTFAVGYARQSYDKLHYEFVRDSDGNIEKDTQGRYQYRQADQETTMSKFIAGANYNLGGGTTVGAAVAWGELDNPTGEDPDGTAFGAHIAFSF